MTARLSFRPIGADDLDFLYSVSASTRQDEFRLLPWDDAAKENLLQLQFAAQHQHYQQYYADAGFDLILLEEQPIGRLYVQRRDDEIWIIDIALLPEHRGAGIGRRIIQALLAEAAAAGTPVRLHVQRNSPALRLYHHLGFRLISDTGVYCLMEWLPQ